MLAIDGFLIVPSEVVKLLDVLDFGLVVGSRDKGGWITRAKPTKPETWQLAETPQKIGTVKPVVLRRFDTVNALADRSKSLLATVIVVALVHIVLGIAPGMAA